MNTLKSDSSLGAVLPAKPSPLKLLRQWAEMIKIEHTVFALPFAMAGLILGCRPLPSWSTVLWTVLSFAGARAAAMTLNRLIDAEIDAKNPRTKTRAIPAGLISRVQAMIFSLLSFALMLWSASHLPAICLWLSPIAILWLGFYSFTKRFTWLCHVCLGVALGGASLGGWVASGGQLNNPAAWLLALAVCTWVAGFDIIYACQDIDIDRRQALCSIPARFGLDIALTISSCLHICTIASLIMLGANLSLGLVYWLGVGQAAVMLTWEHSLVTPTDLTRVNAAFFNINGCVSIATFLAILTDKLLSAHIN